MSVVLAYDPDMAAYDFGGGHPMLPERFTLAVELAREWGLLAQPAHGGTDPDPHEPRARVVRPQRAGDELLRLGHDPALIAAVRAASADPAAADPRFGLSGDTPAFAGMHEAAALAVGGTVAALDAVLGGECRRAFAPAGGLHHAHRDRVAGFCVYNDAVIAISHALLDDPSLRVAYIDLDAHHGDGVQEAFFERADVLTLSVHESGRYLYPGTGAERDVGVGAGAGFALNVGMPPGATDRCYQEVLSAVVTPAVRAYSPDLLVVQLGADVHRNDPLAHLDVTVAGHDALVREIVDLADGVCGGRLVALGGGGYDAFNAVPRMWACALTRLLDVTAPERLPGQWREIAQAAAARHAGAYTPTATFEEFEEVPDPAREADALVQTRRAIARVAQASPLLDAS